MMTSCSCTFASIFPASLINSSSSGLFIVTDIFILLKWLRYQQILFPLAGYRQLSLKYSVLYSNRSAAVSVHDIRLNVSELFPACHHLLIQPDFLICRRYLPLLLEWKQYDRLLHNLSRHVFRSFCLQCSRPEHLHQWHNPFSVRFSQVLR